MNKQKGNPNLILFLLCIVFLTICMLCYPEAAYQGACRGIETWATHLLPSLLPFFIAANLLTTLGFVRFLGVLLEPIMRPLFRLPGEAGFALALGFTSGFPMGAVLTASLKEQQLCSDNEAARLAAFTNNSSPLFLLVAVPVSMLGMPQIGILLLSAHYAANLILGILLRFTAVKTDSVVFQPNQNLFHSAVQQMRLFQIEQNQSIGSLLGQAIQKGITSIVQIGGFVLFFSVLLSMLDASGILFFLNKGFANILTILHFSPQLSSAFTSGLFEMTLGTQSASQCDADLLEQLMSISFILGWSGLSIQAQVCSILSAQHISTKLYCICRPLQGLLAALLIPIFINCFPWMLSHSTMQTTSNLCSGVPYQIPLPLFAIGILTLLLLLSFCITVLHQFVSYNTNHAR